MPLLEICSTNTFTNIVASENDQEVEETGSHDRRACFLWGPKEKSPLLEGRDE